MEIIGHDILGYGVPVVVVCLILFVYSKTRQRNIAYNSIGFLLIMLSITIGATPGFVETSNPEHFLLGDFYKFLGVISGLLGTAICAVVAFKDQAQSNT